MAWVRQAKSAALTALIALSTKLRKVTLEFSVNRSATLWRFPLAPITLSEGGFERVHQGMVSFPWWVLNLAPGETRVK